MENDSGRFLFNPRQAATARGTDMPTAYCLAILSAKLSDSRNERENSDVPIPEVVPCPVETLKAERIVCSLARPI